MGLEVATIGLIVAGAGLAGSVATQVQAAEEQQEASQAAAAVDRSREISKRRGENRKRRIAAARVRAAGENTGTAGSSSEAGALGSLAVSGAASRANQNTTDAAGRIIRRSEKRQSELGAQGAVFDAAKSIGTTIFATSE